MTAPTTIDANMDNDLKIETKPQTLLSILCHEPWYWDSNGWSSLNFQEDGTGELICKSENNVFLAADFLWAATPRTMLHLSSIMNTTAPNPKTKNPPTIPVAQFNLEMTLLNGGMKRLQESAWATFRSEKFLRDEAFRSKVYTLNLEMGEFYTPQTLMLPEITWEPLYASRLTFSPSPYPPQEEWKTREEGGITAPLDEFKFWEWRSFCARKMEKVEEGGESLLEGACSWVGKVDRWAAGFM